MSAAMSTTNFGAEGTPPLSDRDPQVSDRDPPVSEGDLAAAVLAGNRTAIGRALTLVESTKPEHRQRAAALLETLWPHTGDSQRVGISGVPGAGKSTFIEAFGTKLTAVNHRVAVLTVDPSSSLSGGSILADKTRMTKLSTDDKAFIRPTPTAGALGGVTRATRESMLVLEAAGYDIVIVETVGVGQSETLVHDMVDTFVVLMLAGAGDDLQGIKKGVLELADLVAVNKADGDNVQRAELAATELRRALHLLAAPSLAWNPVVVTCSALNGDGLDEIWKLVQQHSRALEENGERDQRRRDQQLKWMRDLVRERLLARVAADTAFVARNTELEAAVQAGKISPSAAVGRLFEDQED